MGSVARQQRGSLDALEKAFDYRGDITITLKNDTKMSAMCQSRIEGRRAVCGLYPPISDERDQDVIIRISARAVFYRCGHGR